MENNVQKHLVKDEITYLDLGLTSVKEFTTHNFGSISLSHEDDFDNYYKIVGITIVANPNRITVERSVYDFLNFLRDVGGLNGILVIFGSHLISFIAKRVSETYKVSTFYDELETEC
jgi:hypothetical protein